MSTSVRPSRSEETKAATGLLFLVGGKDGRTEDRVPLDRFVDLCGGKSAHVLVVTSASDQPDCHREEYREAFHALGVRDISVFHASDRAASEDPELLSSLDHVDGIYFSGGGQRRLMSAMGGTPFEERLRARHRNGLHIGGTSAGASAMSQVMIVQGKDKKPIRPSSVELAAGFGFLPNVIVDQHFQRRGRFSRLVAAVLLHPQMLGFGLDEGTAVEIDSSGRAQVFGKGALAIVDGSRLGANSIGSDGDRPLACVGIGLDLLTEGWSYDLATRKATPPR